MRAVDVAVGVTWAVFWVYWFIAAARSKRAITRPTQGYALRIGIAAVAVALVRLTGFGRQSGATDNPALIGAGLALFGAGLALAVWARLYLGTNWGTPMSEKADPDLVTTGPYRFIRHPIYTGIITASIGTALAITWYWVIIVALFAVYFVYSATVEDGIMARRFPDAYPAYRRPTRMLVPFLF